MSSPTRNTTQQAAIYSAVLIDGSHLEGPTVERVQQVAPHIPADAVEAKYREVVAGGPGAYWYFAVPGVYVRGAYYRFSLKHTPQGTLRLEGRHSSHNSLLPEVFATEYSQEAHEWQKANLDYVNLLDPLNSQGQPRWGWFSENFVRDPSRRVPDYFDLERGADPTPKPVAKGLTPGRPAWVAGLAFVFRQGMGPNDRQSHHRYKARADDRDLIIHSSQHLLWDEVKGANSHISGAPTTWCACCGRSMHMTGCTVCDYRYKDNHFDCGGGPPLDEEAQTLVEKFGWKFAQDPQVARDEADKRK